MNIILENIILLLLIILPLTLLFAWIWAMIWGYQKRGWKGLVLTFSCSLIGVIIIKLLEEDKEVKRESDDNSIF